MSERFLAGGWRMELVWILAFAMPGCGVVNLVSAGDWSNVLEVIRGITGLSFVLCGAAFAWGLWHRRRPVIELCDEWLAFGSIYRARRRRVPLVQIERVDAVGPRIDVTLRSGEVLALPAAELPPGRRRAVRESLERRLARR